MLSRPNLRVLLVDPTKDSRDMYTEYLTECGGFEVIGTDSADDALARSREADVVVTGIWVCGSLNGIELVRRVRHDQPSKPLIVLTACTSDDDFRRAQDAGCDAFLPKPCAPDVLESAIRRVAALDRVSAGTRNTSPNETP